METLLQAEQRQQAPSDDPNQTLSSFPTQAHLLEPLHEGRAAELVDAEDEVAQLLVRIAEAREHRLARWPRRGS
jgi:hypothetical protein